MPNETCNECECNEMINKTFQIDSSASRRREWSSREPPPPEYRGREGGRTQCNVRSWCMQPIGAKFGANGCMIRAASPAGTMMNDKTITRTGPCGRSPGQL